MTSKSILLFCIDDYECLEGLNEKRLTNALKELAADIQKKDIQKVGIVIDNDNFSKEERLNFVNHCLQNTFPEAASLGDFQLRKYQLINHLS